MSVTHFYTCLARSRGVLSVEMQEEILSFSERKGETSLTVELLNRADLDPRLEDKLRESSNLEVLVAWTRRPNRTPQQLQERLLSEKRVTALLPLAQMPNLPESVYRTIGNIKSAKLSESLAANPSVPLDLRVEKIKEFVTRAPKRTYGLGAVIKEICGDEPELYRTVARRTNIIGYITGCVLSGHLTSDDLDAVLARLQTFDVISDIYDYAVWSDLSALFQALAKMPVTEEQAVAARVILTKLESTPSATRHWELGRIKEAVQMIEHRQGELTAKLNELVQASSTDEFESLYGEAKALVSGRDDEQLLADAAAATEHAPSNMVADLYIRGMLSRERSAIVFARLDERGELDLLAKMVAMTAPAVDLEELSQPVEVLRRAIALIRSMNGPLPYWLRNSHFVGSDPDLVVDLYPWSSLLELMRNTSIPAVANGKLAERVQGLLIAEFGSDRKLWEVFETLGEAYEGTIGEMVATVKQLA